MSFTLGKDIWYCNGEGGNLRSNRMCNHFAFYESPCCDKWIENTKHKPLLPDIGRISDKVTKKYGWYVAIFLNPRFRQLREQSRRDAHEMQHFRKDCGAIANEKLKDDYDMNTTHMLSVDRSISAKDTGEMLKKIEEVDG